jgi:hypothetical protein
MLLRFFIRWENIMLMPCTCITYRWNWVAYIFILQITYLSELGEKAHHILVLNAVIILYMKCLHVTIAKADLLFLVLLLPYWAATSKFRLKRLTIIKWSQLRDHGSYKEHDWSTKLVLPFRDIEQSYMKWWNQI